MRTFILALLLGANIFWMPSAHSLLGFLVNKGGKSSGYPELIFKISELSSQGQFEEAIKLAETIAEYEPKGGGDRFLSDGSIVAAGTSKMVLARLYREAGEKNISSFEKALKESEQSSSALHAAARQPHIHRQNMTAKRLELADLYLKAKRYDEAEQLVLDMAKNADEVGAPAEFEQVTLYQKLGSIAIQANDSAKSESYLRIALQRANAMAANSATDKPGHGLTGLNAAASVFSGVTAQLRETAQAARQNIQGLPPALNGTSLSTQSAPADGVESEDKMPHGASINELAAVYSLTGKGPELKKLYEHEFQPYVAQRFKATKQFNEFAGSGRTVAGQYGIERSEFAFAKRFAALGLLDEAESALAAALRLNDERLRHWYSTSQSANLSSGSHEVRRTYAHARLSMALANPSRKHDGLIEALGSAKGMAADYMSAQTRSMATLSPKMRTALTDPNDLAAMMKYLYADPDPKEMRRRVEEMKTNYRRPSQVDERLREEARETVRPLMLAELAASGLVYGAVTEAIIRKRLPKGAAYVEFVKLVKADYTGIVPDAYHYASVSLLPGKDGVEIRDLGPAREIDELTSRFGMEMDTVRKTGRVPDIERAKRIGKELYARLLAPVLKGLETYSTLVICPDGELNLLPFEAFVDDSGSFLISKTDVRYVASSRELIERRPQANSELTAAVFGDPDYDLQTEQASTKPTNAANAAKRAQLRSATGRALRDEKFEALPESRIEAQRVDAAIKKAFGGASKVLLGRDANVQNFLAIGSPRFLHVATHGFFIEAPPTVLAKQGEVEIQYVDPDEYSGIVLTGVNPGLKSGSEAGMVLSNRLSAMNLTNTEMVVLSACSTGLGVATTGEGVYGLKRAIQIAGARSSITSLWNVASEETATLMANFYERLAAEKDTATALRNAKLALMQTKAHPFFWAPFVLSGASAAP